MSCEHLICAQCAGPVAEGRCPTCRAARSHIHQSGPAAFMPVALAVLLTLLLLTLALQHLGH
jgi:hypothetical protein